MIEIFEKHSLGLQKIAVYEGVIHGLNNLSITNSIKENIFKVDSNVYADRTDWNFHEKSKEIFDISEHVTKVCSEISKQEFYLNLNYQVKNCWGIIYKKNNYAQEHDHFPVTFACVIYIKININSSPIIFERGKLVIQPKNNSVLIFPGILSHTVPVSNDNDERVVLAFNVNDINGI
jgi:hypothetical protein